MTIVKRNIKGTALTYDEMDENIRDLHQDTTIDRVLGNGNVTTKNLTIGSLSATSITVNSNSIVTTNTLSSTFAAPPALGNTTPNAITGTTITGNTSINDSKGELRTVPQLIKTVSYVLVSTDHGKHISTDSGITLNTGIFTIGQNVTIFNNSSSSITITQGTSVTIYQAGTSNTGSRTLAQKGIATLLCVDTNTYVINGGGVS